MLRRVEDPTSKLLEPVASLFCYTFGAGANSASELAAAVEAGGLVVVVEVANEVIGAATASILTQAEHAAFAAQWAPIPFASPLGVLDRSAVAAEHRGRGLGWSLAVARLSWLAARGASMAAGTVWVQSPAPSVKIWSKLGTQVAYKTRYWASTHSKTRPCSRCGPVCECDAALYVVELR